MFRWRWRGAEPSRDPERSIVEHRIGTLQTAYLADRADNYSANLSALAIVSAALVYLGALAAYLLPRCGDGTCATSEVPYIVLLAAPIPAISLISYLLLVLAGSITRTAYILEVEDELSQLTSIERPPRAPDFQHRALNIHGGSAQVRFRVLEHMSYLGAGIVVVGATGGPMYLAARSSYDFCLRWSLWGMAAGLYAIAIASMVLGLVWAFRNA